MPELPEVETTVRGLRRTVIGEQVINVWTDWPKYFKPHKKETLFKKEVLGRTIKNIRRIGKNILIEISDNRVILIHQKMSGHLMVGRWISNSPRNKAFVSGLGPAWTNQKWLPAEKLSKFSDLKNRFIRFLITFKSGKMLALSDLRRFAKIAAGPKKTILNLPNILNLGPDPTSKKFTFNAFKKIIKNKKTSIKKTLLDQTVINGIGNIYADEVLWLSKIHPQKLASNLPNSELQKLFSAIKKILPVAIKNRGTSMDDYRDVYGAKGFHERHLSAYQKTNRPCLRCKTPIQRFKISGRSTHFCPKCQDPKNNR